MGEQIEKHWIWGDQFSNAGYWLAKKKKGKKNQLASMLPNVDLKGETRSLMSLLELIFCG